jgi:phage baseplate assembly protein gpV
VSDELLAGIKSSLGLDEENEKKVRPKFYGVTVGTVINPLDPMFLGRLQVRLPFIDSLDLSPWARVATMMAGPFHGSYFIPNVGDEVLVAFEHGDVNAPYIIGSLWNLAAPPPLPSPVPQIRALRTLAGAQIVFQELPPTIYIQTPTPPEVVPLPPSPVGPHQTMMLSPAGINVMSPTQITLQSGTSTVTVSPAGVLLQAGGSSIAVTPAGVFLQGGGGAFSLTMGNASLIAPMVRINS